MGPPNVDIRPQRSTAGNSASRAVPGITGGVPDGTGGVGPGMPGGPPAAQNPAARSPFAERFGTGPGGIDPNARPGPTTSIPPQAAVPPAPLTPPAPSAPSPFATSPGRDFDIPGRVGPGPGRGQSVVGRSPGRSTQGQRTDDPFDLPIFEDASAARAGNIADQSKLLRSAAIDPCDRWARQSVCRPAACLVCRVVAHRHRLRSRPAQAMCRCPSRSDPANAADRIPTAHSSSAACAATAASSPHPASIRRPGVLACARTRCARRAISRANSVDSVRPTSNRDPSLSRH